MLYRRLGRTGLHVSELSYGAARGATPDAAPFIDTVHAAIDGGVNFIDTAADYGRGDCERALGEALRGHDDVLVETKYQPYDGRFRVCEGIFYFLIGRWMELQCDRTIRTRIATTIEANDDRDDDRDKDERESVIWGRIGSRGVDAHGIGAMIYLSLNIIVPILVPILVDFYPCPDPCPDQRQHS